MRKKLLLLFILSSFFLLLTLQNSHSLDSCKKLGDPANCFQKTLVNTIKSKGLKAGFQTFGELYKEGSLNANSCHILAHVLGQEAYKIKGNEGFIRIETISSCAYGFYHGLMEASFARGKGIETANNFCWDLQKSSKIPDSKEISKCFHGIGHGITDYYTYLGLGIQNSIDKGMAACKSVARGNSQILEYCGVGVFGSTSASYLTGKYKMDMNDPFSICRLQIEVSSKFCYTAIPNVILIKNNADFDRALSIVLDHLPDSKKLASFAVETTSYEYAKLDFKNDFVKVIKRCQSLPDGLSRPCIRGYASGMVTLKQNQAKGKIFCEEVILLEEERKVCFGGFLSALKKNYDVKTFAKFCRDLREFCEN